MKIEDIKNEIAEIKQSIKQGNDFSVGREVILKRLEAMLLELS